VERRLPATVTTSSSRRENHPRARARNINAKLSAIVDRRAWLGRRLEQDETRDMRKKKRRKTRQVLKARARENNILQGAGLRAGARVTPLNACTRRNCSLPSRCSHRGLPFSRAPFSPCRRFHHAQLGMVLLREARCACIRETCVAALRNARAYARVEDVLEQRFHDVYAKATSPPRVPCFFRSRRVVGIASKGQESVSQATDANRIPAMRSNVADINSESVRAIFNALLFKEEDSYVEWRWSPKKLE